MVSGDEVLYRNITKVITKNKLQKLQFRVNRSVGMVPD